MDRLTRVVVMKERRSTVLTRNYAPPFCGLGLAKSMGGAYN